MSHGEGDRVCLLDAWEGSGQQETPREPISELWRITSAVQLGFLYCYVPSPLTPSPHKTLFRHDGLVSAFTERNSEKGPIPGQNGTAGNRSSWKAGPGTTGEPPAAARPSWVIEMSLSRGNSIMVHGSILWESQKCWWQGNWWKDWAS